MKDYSMSLEERKDFILGYNITKEGQMIVEFAKGKPWTIPYNNENEHILLEKMEKQLEKSSKLESKLENKKNSYLRLLIPFFSGTILCFACTLTGYVTEYVISGSVLGCIGLIPGFLAIKNKLKLDDLRKNKKFLEIKEKLNESVRTNQNTLVGVSNKTKRAIKDFPEDKTMFNINSFNYVPYRDIEQIIDNVDRNEKFGFDYTEQEKPAKGIARKRKR